MPESSRGRGRRRRRSPQPHISSEDTVSTRTTSEEFDPNDPLKSLVNLMIASSIRTLFEGLVFTFIPMEWENHQLPEAVGRSILENRGQIHDFPTSYHVLIRPECPPTAGLCHDAHAEMGNRDAVKGWQPTQTPESMARAVECLTDFLSPDRKSWPKFIMRPHEIERSLKHGQLTGYSVNPKKRPRRSSAPDRSSKAGDVESHIEDQDIVRFLSVLWALHSWTFVYENNGRRGHLSLPNAGTDIRGPGRGSLNQFKKHWKLLPGLPHIMRTYRPYLWSIYPEATFGRSNNTLGRPKASDSYTKRSRKRSKVGRDSSHHGLQDDGHGEIGTRSSRPILPLPSSGAQSRGSFLDTAASRFRSPELAEPCTQPVRSVGDGDGPSAASSSQDEVSPRAMRNIRCLSTTSASPLRSMRFSLWEPLDDQQAHLGKLFLRNEREFIRRVVQVGDIPCVPARDTPLPIILPRLGPFDPLLHKGTLAGVEWWEIAESIRCLEAGTVSRTTDLMMPEAVKALARAMMTSCQASAALPFCLRGSSIDLRNALSPDVMLLEPIVTSRMPPVVLVDPQLQERITTGLDSDPARGIATCYSGLQRIKQQSTLRGIIPIFHENRWLILVLDREADSGPTTAKIWPDNHRITSGIEVACSVLVEKSGLFRLPPVQAWNKMECPSLPSPSEMALVDKDLQFALVLELVIRGAEDLMFCPASTTLNTSERNSSQHAKSDSLDSEAAESGCLRGWEKGSLGRKIMFWLAEYGFRKPSVLECLVSGSI